MNQAKRKGPSNAGIATGAGIQAGGSLLASGMQMYEAHKQRKFQREMSNTSHFREMRDLKRSGLNPILSVTGGGGAPSPQGAQARIGNPTEGVTALTHSQAEMNSAQTSKLEQEELTGKLLGSLYSAQASKIWADMPLTKLKGELVDKLREPFEGGFDMLHDFGRSTGKKLSQEHIKYKKWHDYLNTPLKKLREKITNKAKKYYNIGGK